MLLRISTLNHTRRVLQRSLSTSTTERLFRLEEILDPWDSLGLTNSPLVQQPSIQETLWQLPEVRESLEQQNLSEDAFERGIDIFSAMGSSSEKTALTALLTEAKHHHGDFQGTLKCLNDLPHLTQLVHAKCLWLQGDFSQAQKLCEDALQDDDNNHNNSTLTTASARTGLAVARLLSVETVDDVFSVRDPFRMVLAQLKGGGSNALVRAAAHLNCGIAEAVYAQVLEDTGHAENVPLDGALRSWKQGLTLLQRRSSSSSSSAKKDNSYRQGVERALQARLHANMAWGLLQMNHVKEASKSASESLKIYDNNKAFAIGGFSRTLSLVAECYHRSGAAVTAEGLFQSAIAEPTTCSTLEWVNHRDTLNAYAKLLVDWEKRHGDSERLKVAAENAALPKGWKNKSGIHSSLWFWLPTQI